MPSVSITNTFASQSAPIVIQQLDANFFGLTTYLNSTLVPHITATAIPGFAASVAQQRTATATASFVTPGRQNQHPSAVKAWAIMVPTTVNGAISFSGYGVTSVTRTGTGTYSIAFSNTMATTTYPIIASTNVFAPIAAPSNGVISATGFEMVTYFGGGVVPADYAPYQLMFLVFGDLA